MRPGSSDRCKSKYGKYRCNRHVGHDGHHQSKRGYGMTVWGQ